MGRRGRESPTHDLGLCSRIRAESVGRPGKRRFRLHAYAEHGTALLWMEKEQLYELALAIKQLRGQMYLESSESGTGAADDSPVDYQFKAARLVLGHDEATRTYWLVADVAVEGGAEEGRTGQARQPADVALRIAEEQMDRLADEALVVCAGGRPRCPLCGAPINEGEPHICPRSNGHVHL